MSATRCARDKVVEALRSVSFGAIGEASVFEGDYDAVADVVLDALGIDRGMSLEPHWLLRRADGEDLFDEFTNQVVHSPDDWESAEVDSCGEDESVEYEMVTHVYTHVMARTYLDGEQLLRAVEVTTPAEQREMCAGEPT